MQTLTLTARIKAFSKLGEYIISRPALLDAYVQRTSHHNGWFTSDNQWKMLTAVAEDYLAESALRTWTETYRIASEESGKVVGIVMAGNIPVVGFHDWLAVLISGNQAQVKLSEKDPFVLPFLAKKLAEIEPAFEGRSRFVERLKTYDAVIATGSDNTSRYFKQYFGKYPHIIRGNRTSVAVLDGNETQEQLIAIAEDVFTYFGLGCRSVGKIYVPQGYVFEPLLEILHEHRQLANHSKWKNNFDYNYALLTINKESFLSTGSIMLREDKALHSRLATLHYEYYSDTSDLVLDLHQQKEELQAIVSSVDLPGLATVYPGKGQRPGLSDYADGKDVMEFLTRLQ